MNSIRIFLAVFLASPLGTLFAQDAATSEINAKIAVYIWAKGSFGDEVDIDGNIIFKYTPPEVKFADASGKVVDMDVYPNRRTPFIKYKGSPNIQFFRDVKLKGQDQAIRQPVGQITLPATTRSALLMFYPLNPEMTTFNVFPLTDVAETIPAGKALVFNTCPFDVGVQMGGEPGFQLAAQNRQLAGLNPHIQIVATVDGNATRHNLAVALLHNDGTTGPPILGRLERTTGQLVLTPRHALSHGLRYRATLTLPDGRQIYRIHAIPPRSATAPPSVVNPEATALPAIKFQKDYFVQFQFWVRNKNEWSKVYSSKKAIHPESSLILIIHPRENNPRLVDMLALSAF